MPKGKKKISKKEFARGFGDDAIKYLESQPVAERPARIEAFGKSVLSSCAVIAEDEPQADEKSINHFCPEVSYLVYGLFASFLHEYIDDIDREAVYEYHKRAGTLDQHDAQWNWITPQHYTECREYSIHATFATGKPSKISPRPGEVSPKRRWEVLAKDSFTCDYCGRKPPEVILHADHRVSVKDGGTYDLENLVTARDKCNGGKGASGLFDGGKPSVSPGQS